MLKSSQTVQMRAERRARKFTWSLSREALSSNIHSHTRLVMVGTSSQLVNCAVLTVPHLASDKMIYNSKLWDRWPPSGLCSWADWISSSDPRGLDQSTSQYTHTLRLYLNWQLPYYSCHISGTSEASVSPVLHSFPFSSWAVWLPADRGVFRLSRDVDWLDSGCNTDCLSSCFRPQQ